MNILVRGERTVQELQEALGLEAHRVPTLAVLRNQTSSGVRRKGCPCGTRCETRSSEDLLDVARQIFNNHLVNTQGMLRELQREARRG